MTMERPGIMTRPDVKTSVNEGKGISEVPMIYLRKGKD